MTDKEWLYQVWVHEKQLCEVYLAETYEREYQARNFAQSMNMAEAHDSCPDRPTRLFYFVRSVSRKQIEEDALEKIRTRKERASNTKLLKSKYHKALLPVAKEMVSALLFSLENCEQPDALQANGGWLDSISRQVEGLGPITCSVFFSGIGKVYLQACIEDNNEPTMVESFQSMDGLRSWLQNTDRAASTIENRIIQVLDSMERLRAQAERQIKN